jgi:DNA invertase Pin-like site-specific DNA recombinase
MNEQGGTGGGRRIRVALYARVSTFQQNIESQLIPLREFASLRGFDVIGEYKDVGVSGIRYRREGLDKLMDGARKRLFDGVVVFQFSRFARSVKHLVEALAEFRALGISFMSYSENIDTSSPIGEAIFAVIAALAQLERDLIRERVQAGLRRAKAEGRRLGRPTTGVSPARAVEAFAAAGSIRAAARTLRISASSVARLIKAAQMDGRGTSGVA